jgi:hypothetical protein
MKKAMAQSCSRFLLFWFCCSKEGDNTRAIVALFFYFWFCVNKEGDNNFDVVTFFFSFLPSFVFILL